MGPEQEDGNDREELASNDITSREANTEPSQGLSPSEGAILPKGCEVAGDGVAEEEQAGLDAGSDTPEPTSESDSQKGGPVLLATAWFTVLFVASGLTLLYLFRNYVTDALLGFLLAGLAYPLYRRVLAGVGNRSYLAATLVTTIVITAIVVPLGFVIISLYGEAASLVATTREAVAAGELERFLAGDSFVARTLRDGGSFFGVAISPDEITETLTAAGSKVGTMVYQALNDLLSNLVLAGLHFFLLVLFVFYGLIDGHRIKAFLFRLSPLPDDEEELIGRRFMQVGKATLFGNGLGSLPQGILGGLAMWAAGLPSPALWGTVMAVFAFLPVVGIAVVVVPATVYLLLKGQVLVAVVFLSFCTAQSVVIENVVKTKLIGSQMRMHSLLIFVAILGGLGSFGVIGLLYGPLLVALFLTLVDLYEQRYIKRFRQRGDPAA